MRWQAINTCGVEIGCPALERGKPDPS
jgi:hypothetical protein